MGIVVFYAVGEVVRMGEDFGGEAAMRQKERCVSTSERAEHFCVLGTLCVTRYACMV